VNPDRILGKSVFWWMDKLSILRASRESAIGRYLMKTDPFPGKALELDRLREQGVVVVGCIVRAEGKKVAFASGETTEVDTVPWATGYEDDTDWVAIPEVKDERGRFIHQRGTSPIPNLYFIGRSRQWTRGSALLVRVGADAAYLTKHIVKHFNESAVAQALSGNIAKCSSYLQASNHRYRSTAKRAKKAVLAILTRKEA
jgi:putative flavoprotein involved in K+ transport